MMQDNIEIDKLRVNNPKTKHVNKVNLHKYQYKSQWQK